MVTESKYFLETPLIYCHLTLDFFPNTLHSVVIRVLCFICYPSSAGLSVFLKGFSIGTVDVLCNKIYLKLTSNKFTNEGARNRGFSRERLINLSLASLSCFLIQYQLFAMHIQKSKFSKPSNIYDGSFNILLLGNLYDEFNADVFLSISETKYYYDCCR